MKRAAAYSALLHIVILAVLTIGFFNPFRQATLNQPPILVEIATIQEVSTAPVLTPEMQEAEGAKPKEPDPKPQEQPAPVQDQPAPQKPEPEPQEETPKQEPVKEPHPVPAPKPVEKQKKIEEKKEETPVKPRPRPKALVNLSKKEATKTEEKPETKKKSASFDDLINENAKDVDKPAKTKGAPASKVGEVVSASEMEALRRHMAKCWLVPAGARGAKELIVDIDLEIGKDRIVTKAVIVDKSRMTTDNFYRAAAESAQRAVLDPKCNPLPLPPEKYDQWKNMTFSFNPKDMF